MEQEKLERKVVGLFEEQGFEVFNEDNNVFFANNNNLELQLYVFSSENYGCQDIKNLEVEIGSNIKIFVDEGLKKAKEIIGDNVSVIHEFEDEEKFDLPSYELIGDLAVINDIQDYAEDKVVEGIKSHHPSIKTILVKEDALKGEFRVGDYNKICGEETETIHKEFGCRFLVDPTKTYFSERFGSERDEVTSSVEGEKVLVMFAGVGPFAILAANRGADKVVAVEKNPVACNYLKQNIGLNNLEDNVESFCGDVRDVLPNLEERFNRVIMPLPGSAIDFLDIATGVLKQEGIIHLYAFVENEDFSGLEAEISGFYSDLDLGYKILGRSRCGVVSPSKDRYRIDIRVTR